MAELKHKAENFSRELKAILEDAVKSEEENILLKKKITEMEKQHAKEIADLVAKQQK